MQELRSRGEAIWRPFDWDSGDWDSGDIPLRSKPIRTRAVPVAILEGAYSARPELSDYLDLRVLLDTPSIIRRRQLLEREGEDYRADWEARWSEAEDYYFGTVVPDEHFDLVLDVAPLEQSEAPA